MAVSPKILKKRGCTAEAIKKLAIDNRLALQANAAQTMAAPKDIDPKVEGTKNEKWQNFQTRAWNRCIAGREYNIANWRTYYALDQAWEAPHKQVNPTLLGTLLDADASSPEVESALKTWGFDISKVVEEYTPDPKTPGKKAKRINVPAFTDIVPSLMKTYLTIRLAKLMNDRRTVPFLPYNPVISTALSRLQCEVISDRIEVMSNQYGYFNDVKQAVFQMLLYSFSIMLPSEEWHSEAQETDDKDQKHYSEDGKDYRIVREGIRHYIPHPAKSFLDRAHRPSSINTDTGVNYLGYWRIIPFKEIRENEGWFNKDAVSVGTTDWWSSASTYLNNVFSGCVMTFPSVSAGAGAPVGNDREVNNADQFYSQAWDDKAVTLTEYFEKAIPKDIGLGDYDCPVWFRFVFAGNGTIIYGAPLCYQPGIFMAYDLDDNREKNASLGLEILPYQDMFANVMSQWVRTIKQNLTNVNFYDSDVIDDGDMSLLKNVGERFYRTLNWIKFSGVELAKKLGLGGGRNSATAGIDKVFHSQRFAAQNTAEQLQGMKTIIEVLERNLQMSSQEAGQASSHELRAEEVRTINNSSSSRLKFTGIPVDEAMDAMKRQLYDGLMAYGEADFSASVSHDPTLNTVEFKKALTALGFTWSDDPYMISRDDKKIPLTVKKLDAIQIDAFASHRDSIDRADNPQVAAAMAAAFSNWMSNPIIAQAIGPQQAIDYINKLSLLAGMPRDFVLRAQQGQPGQGQGQPDPQQMTDQFRQMLVQMAQQIEQKVGQELQGVRGEVAQALKPINDEVIGIEHRFSVIENALHIPPPAAEMPQGNAIPSNQVSSGPGNPPSVA